MKRIFFSLVLVFGILSAFAQNEFVVDGLKYSILYRSFKTCSVVGFATADNNTKNVIIPESVTYRDVEYTVTEIGSKAFANSVVETVNIPSTITTIGSQAFYFSQLQSVTIPSSIKIIDTQAFSQTQLKEVIIPKNVISIRFDPFGSCPNLENIIVEDDNPNYSSVDGVLYNKAKDVLLQCPGARKEMIVPDEVYFIYHCAFSGCDFITSIVLPESVREIGLEAFEGCSSLISINIPEGILSIEDFTFASCKSLQYIKLPSSLVAIEYAAFSGCSSLTSIILPASIKRLAESAFNSCTSLESMSCLSDNLVYADAYAFYNLPEDAKLYVKADLIEEYENSNWAKYFSQVLPLEDRPVTGAVEEIEIDNSLPFDVYGLSGVPVKKNVCKENLKDIPAGIYILRQGNASKKIILR